NDPEMKVSASGVIYAAWMNDYDVVFAKSSDHGATWSTPIDFKKASGLSFTDKPILIISADGHDVYVAFNSSDSYVVASHDSSPQQPPCTVKNCPADFFGSQIAVAVARAGTLMVAYSANDAVQAPLHLFARTSADCVTWSARADIDPRGTAAGAGFPEIAAG